MAKVSVNFRLPQELVAELKQQALLVDKDMTRLVIEAIKTMLESKQVECIHSVNTYIDGCIDNVNTRIDTLQAEVAKLKSRLKTVEEQPSSPKPKTQEMPPNKVPHPNSTHEEMTKLTEVFIKHAIQLATGDADRERDKQFPLGQHIGLGKYHEANNDASVPTVQGILEKEPIPPLEENIAANGTLAEKGGQPRRPNVVLKSDIVADWLTASELYRELTKRGYTKAKTALQRLLATAIQKGELPDELKCLGVQADFQLGRTRNLKNNSVRWLRVTQP